MIKMNVSYARLRRDAFTEKEVVFYYDDDDNYIKIYIKKNNKNK